ncbi:MAG: PP2C family protein-serine/threonine phosphatase [Opitutales bacterium]
MTSNNMPPAAIRWWGLTDPGRFRKKNEDAFLGLQLDGLEVFRLGSQGQGSFGQGDFVFAVSDGMGGAQAGEYASQIAVDKISELLPRSFRLKATGLHPGGEDFLEELFERTHQEMVNLGRAYEETAGMGATLSLIWFTPEKAYFGHAGDSRLYHLARNSPIQQVSYDHTHVGWLVRQGKLSELEARRHPAKAALQMALGGKIRNVEPQLGTILYEPGDWFVLCTDGITDGVSTSKIEGLVREPPPRDSDLPPPKRLVNEAAFTSRDNMTAIVLQILEPEGNAE